MKVAFDNTNTMTFEVKNEREKVFAMLGTLYGDGRNYVTLMTEEELDSCGYNKDEWSKDVKTMAIGETSTYGYWFYDKANFMVRLA